MRKARLTAVIIVTIATAAVSPCIGAYAGVETGVGTDVAALGADVSMVTAVAAGINGEGARHRERVPPAFSLRAHHAQQHRKGRSLTRTRRRCPNAFGAHKSPTDPIPRRVLLR